MKTTIMINVRDIIAILAVSFIFGFFILSKLTLFLGEKISEFFRRRREK